MRKSMIVAVLIGTVVLTVVIWQKREEQLLLGKSRDLQEAIRDNHSGTRPSGRERTEMPGRAGGLVEGNPEIVFGDGHINWDRYLEIMLLEEVISIRDARDQILIEERFQEMTVVELVAALEESRELELSVRERSRVDQKFINLLKLKDPVAALNEFRGELNGKYRYELGLVFEALAKDDLAGAGRWLDEQVEEGRMELRSLFGEDYVRSEYERVLIEQMFVNDIRAASRRLTGMPEDLRVKSLVNADTTRLNEEQTQAMARLVKEQLSERGQAKVFSHYARDHIVARDLSRVNSFMEQIDPTPQIASQCVETVVRKCLSTGGKSRLGDLNTLRDWARGQISGPVESVMGSAVGNALFGHGSPDASDLILDYYAAHGSDEFLAAVVANAYILPEPQAEKILRAIPDEARRREMRNLYEAR